MFLDGEKQLYAECDIPPPSTPTTYESVRVKTAQQDTIVKSHGARDPIRSSQRHDQWLGDDRSPKAQSYLTTLSKESRRSEGSWRTRSRASPMVGPVLCVRSYRVRIVCTTVLLIAPATMSAGLGSYHRPLSSRPRYRCSSLLSKGRDADLLGFGKAVCSWYYMWGWTL